METVSSEEEAETDETSSGERDLHIEPRIGAELGGKENTDCTKVLNIRFCTEQMYTDNNLVHKANSDTTDYLSADN